MDECLGPVFRKVCASSTVIVRYFWQYKVLNAVFSECGSLSGRDQGSFLPLALEKNTALKSCCRAYVLKGISTA